MKEIWVGIIALIGILFGLSIMAYLASKNVKSKPEREIFRKEEKI